MKHIHICTSLLIAGLALTSCYREVELDNYRDNQADLLTLNSLICAGEPIKASATATFFFSDEHNKRQNIPGLTIALAINGEQKGTLTYNAATGMYETGTTARPGDAVTLSTTYKNAGITCTDTVPAPVQIEDIDITVSGPVAIYTPADYILTYHITFSDPAGAGNHYFLQYDADDQHHDYHMGERDFTHELVFQKLANLVHSTLPGWKPYSPDGLPFTDDGIDGATHTLQVREILQGNNGNPYQSDPATADNIRRRISLHTISKAYFDYLFTILLNQTDDRGLEGGMIDIGIADPIKVYSNITGGTGILGCHTLSSRTVDVLQYTGPFPR